MSRQAGRRGRARVASITRPDEVIPMLLLRAGAAPMAGRWPATLTVAPDAWAAEHFATAELGDARRARRAVEVAARMAAHPEASLPAQLGTRAALRGAY